jgi:hypothetical protein
MGGIMTNPSNPSWGDVGWQRAMLNNGAIGYSWDGDFENHPSRCEPEFSFVNKCGINISPASLPNGGNDPVDLTYEHWSSWGNYAGSVHRTLYIRMEKA